MAYSNTSWNETVTNGLPGSERWMEVVSAVWMVSIILLGVLENGVILYVFTRNKQFVTSTNIPVIAMLVNGLLMASFASPLPLIAELSGGWTVYMSLSSCTFAAFFVYLFGLASLYILLEITLWRYFTITNPLGSARLTNKHALIGVFISYAIAAVFALCPLFGFGSYGLEAHGTSCGLAWEDQSTSGKTYLVVILVGCFLVPVTVMVMSYSAIFKVVKKASVFPFETASSLRFRRQREKERKLLRLSITMVVAYLICWTPYTVVSFYIGFGNPGDLHPLVTRLPALMAKSEVVWNPIIYTLQTRPFRLELYRMIPITWLRHKLQNVDVAETVHERRKEMSVSVVPDTGTPKVVIVKESQRKDQQGVDPISDTLSSSTE